jgi:hypothetical protein
VVASGMRSEAMVSTAGWFVGNEAIGIRSLPKAQGIHLELLCIWKYQFCNYRAKRSFASVSAFRASIGHDWGAVPRCEAAFRWHRTMLYEGMFVFDGHAFV